MIDRKTREKFLAELEKIGNILHACKKVGIPFTSTVYRWASANDKFKKRMDEAIRIGRANIVDIAEGGLVRKAGEGDFKSQTFILRHHSQMYRPRNRDEYVFVHKRDGNAGDNPPISMDDLLDEMSRRGEELIDENRRDALAKQLPLKPDGNKIMPWEEKEYVGYIAEYRKLLNSPPSILKIPPVVAPDPEPSTTMANGPKLTARQKRRIARAKKKGLPPPRDIDAESV